MPNTEQKNGIVEVVEAETTVTPGQLWQPHMGEEVDRLRERLPDGAADAIIEDAVKILAQCAPPVGGEVRRAGLVVGEVQSGKTASFTSVMALARDNRYGLIVLITGTTKNLTAQSKKRLHADLRLDEPEAYRRWFDVSDPKAEGEDVDLIVSALEDIIRGPDYGEIRGPDYGEIRGPDYGEQAPTVLITVMKNHSHMSKLAKVLKEVGRKVSLASVASLVIDDEADQASQNISKIGTSTTYRNLAEIRNSLPRHTLLGYTATPQAPLLIALTDELSPEFVCVLRSGSDYTGGKYFFQENREHFVRYIPPKEVLGTSESPPDPPPTLYGALATYLLGAASTQSKHSGPCRSMLVHPSSTTDLHQFYATCLKMAKSSWSKLLKEEDSGDRQELVEKYFNPAYEDLSTSEKELEELDKLLEMVPSIIDKTHVKEINSSSNNGDVNFNKAFSWILIGGQKLDRGFTVEGLTVTYMPRGTGVGNADTVEQRGRFFGYKRSYAGLCRAWLSPETATAFTDYVAHESAMRKELIKEARTGSNLKDWRRSFILSPALKPTRSAVIKLSTVRVNLSDSWFQQWQVPIPAASGDLGDKNQALTKKFCSGLDFKLDEEHPNWTSMQKHSRATVRLSEALDQFLADFEMVEGDSSFYTMVLLDLVQQAEKDKETPLTVYKMSNGQGRSRAVVGDSTKLKGLFQGRSPNGEYPGDREIYMKGELSLQIHFVDVHADSGHTADAEQEQKGELIRAGVPVIALYVPKVMKIDGIAQK